MPRLSLVADQHRHAIGNYTHRQDSKYGSQRQQDERVKVLASRPGLHSENSHRQNLAHALVQLLSILNIVSNSTVRVVKNLENTESQSVTPLGLETVPQSVTPLGLETVPQARTLLTSMITQGERISRATTEVSPVSYTASTKRNDIPIKNRIIQYRQKAASKNRNKNIKLIHFLRKKCTAV
ncbi:MAG: hypothetical protein ACMZI0_06585 [Symbiopectobacterium sp.]|uniref:hypothetical protein n=1 Tax=Symbiopectobacterium sp. TaxID=2952789 RepID=UPI0039E779C1